MSGRDQPRRGDERPAAKTVYVVTERGERSFWNRVGVAFTNRDGSLTVKLDALPVSGVLQIRDDEQRGNGDEG